jgi:SAM-dependent methyltransferase
MARAMRVEPLVERVAALVEGSGRGLDCACGRGQHAVVLAGAGLVVDAFDREGPDLERLRRFVAETGVAIHCFVADLATYSPPPASYTAVVATKVLHLFAPPVADRIVTTLRDAVAPGGVAVVTAFAPTAAIRAAFPAALAAGTYLDADQLRDRFAGWEIVDESADDMELEQRGPDGCAVIVRKLGVIARRPR